MRGEIDLQAYTFSYVDLKNRIPKGHPISKIRHTLDSALHLFKALMASPMTA